MLGILFNASFSFTFVCRSEEELFDAVIRYAGKFKVRPLATALLCSSLLHLGALI
jgi:hypothetical protein